MPLRNSLIAFLLLGGFSLVAPGCALPAKTFQSYPSVSDLRVEPKPVPPADIVTSEAAADAYDIAIEGWADRGWQAVHRVCIWAKASGLKQPPC
jgi:hypothetical protein